MPPGIHGSATRTQRRRATPARALRALLACAAIAGALLSPAAAAQAAPSAPFASLTTGFSAVAQFNRLTFDNTPSSSDSRMALIVLQRSYTVASYISALRASHPGIKALAYQALWWMRPGDKLGYSDCLPGSASYAESWYLHDGKGVRESWGSGTSIKYGMDFGNASYLQSCAQHIVANAKAIGADGVFLDGAPSSVHWAQFTSPCTPSPPASPTCSSDARFQAAMTHALSYVAGQLHANGLLAFVNISGGNVTFCCGGGPSIWDQYVSQVDGSMQEAWTYGTNHLPLPATEVIAGLGNTAWSEANHKYVLVNDDITNCQTCSLYGLATMMLVAGGYSSYDIANGIYTGTSNGVWWPSYTTAQAVGAALGPYTTLADGLMIRRFSAHTVVVNDTTAAIKDPTYGTVAATSALIR